MDLYEPGSGSQVHDYNGGVQPSGLFWLVRVGPEDLWVSDDGDRATLVARDLPVVDSFQFGGTDIVPAVVSFTISWEALGERRPRGEGRDVEPTDPAAFRGNFARARSRARFSGSALGFAFRSNEATTDRGYAQMGFQRNGVFLEG